MLKNVCGCRLNTFAVVIGWLYIIKSATAFILVLNLLLVLTRWTVVKSFDIAIVTFGVACTITSIVAAIFLIIGVIKERHFHILLWLTSEMIAIIYLVIFIIRSLITEMGSMRLGAGELVSKIIYTFIVVLKFYIWYIIYSLYNQIRAKNEIKETSPAAENSIQI